jgi:lysozyme family protein
MHDVSKITDEIVARDGGYVNDPDDPDDPGGATNHGVTIHTMRRLGLDLDGDGQVDEQDVRVLDRDLAVEIFVIIILTARASRICLSICMRPFLICNSIRGAMR